MTSLFSNYRLLTRDKTGDEVSRNNLGVAYNHFEAFVHAAEQFKAASEMGSALATANVIRQYLRAGFVREAEEWAEARKPGAADPKGQIVQALAALHAERASEEERIGKVIANELSHRTSLATFADLAILAQAVTIGGEYLFPAATLLLRQTGDQISGKGQSSAHGGTRLHKLTAKYSNYLWRFDTESKLESEYVYRSESFGILNFKPNGDILVLEYRQDGEVLSYSAPRAPSRIT